MAGSLTTFGQHRLRFCPRLAAQQQGASHALGDVS